MSYDISGSPFDAIHAALSAACSRDLPNIVYPASKYRKTETIVRPMPHDCIVHMWPQTWSDTALGYDDQIAGQAFTTAYTVVVVRDGYVCVYFGDREQLAYSFCFIDLSHKGIENWNEDFAARNIASVILSKDRYFNGN